MRKKEKEVTDIHELESIISRADVCRIAFAEQNVPYMVTMNFGYLKGGKGTLFFHCASEGRKIEMIRKNNLVCFEMDTDHELVTGKNACDFTMKYKSIVGYGYISIVTDEAERINGLNQIMSHYSGEKEFRYKPDSFRRTTILKVEITEISGKMS